MSRQRMVIIAAVLVVSVGTWWLIKRHADKSASDSEAQSQLPAEDASANYSVPPDIGVSVNNTGGANFPQGENGYMYTVGQAQSLPSQ